MEHASRGWFWEMSVQKDWDLVEQCAAEALTLLHRNLTPHGIIAASRTREAEDRNYTRIFGRDAAICTLGILHAGDSVLQQGAKESLLTLARHQAENGQIPKYVDPDRDEADFWYLGCIDATLWWLIAVKLFDRHRPQECLTETLSHPITKAIVWLRCQEHPRLFLLQQNEASDWADIMPRSGFVLYSNALWYYVKRLYALPHAQETRYHFNHLFFPFSHYMPDYRRLRLLTHYVRHGVGRRDLYLSFVNFSFWGEEGDVFGNLLAVLLGLANHGPANRILYAIEKDQVDAPYPVRAVCTPVARNSRLWRHYMGRHRQNLEYQYHNGGIWPFVGGFWVMALAAMGQGQKAREALVRLAHANRLGAWSFTEWLHGRTGEPRGMTGQSWNAAMFLLAQQSLETKIFLL
jgi:glycogen debranching enzyme